MKRATSSSDRPVSPPAVKRKIESTTTSKTVASFFKPASQKNQDKEPESLTWRILDHSLIIGSYTTDPATPPAKAFELQARSQVQAQAQAQEESRRVRVAAFDLDDTIITPLSSNNRFARSETSWKWWDTCVPGRLRDLHSEGYLVVLLSNQGNISLKDNAKSKSTSKPSLSMQKDTLSLTNFKKQASSVLRQLDFPVTLFAATAQDRYRKPRTGMWDEMVAEYDLESLGSIDLENSFYVGDAAGREKTDLRRKDHATSDRDLAANIGIKFHTPDEYFLGAKTEEYTHSFQPQQYLVTTAAAAVPSLSTSASLDVHGAAIANNGAPEGLRFQKRSGQELVIFCGSPGAGKSTFYFDELRPLGFERVNQDILKSRDRCLKVAREFLTAGSSVAVDNTNADVETRAYWIRLAQEFKVPVRCVYFTASARLCEHNDAVRAHNPVMNPENRTILPGIAFRSFVQRFVRPELKEGFQDIIVVEFEFSGTEQQKEIWSKYWVSKFST